MIKIRLFLKLKVELQSLFCYFCHRQPQAELFVIDPAGGWHIYSFLVSNCFPHCSLHIRSENMSDRHWVTALYRGKYLKYTSGPQCPLQLHTPPMQAHYSAEDVSLPFCSDQPLHKPFWKREQASTLQNKTPTDQWRFLKLSQKAKIIKLTATCSKWKKILSYYHITCCILYNHVFS